jgi:hypothetical protein
MLQKIPKNCIIINGDIHVITTVSISGNPCYECSIQHLCMKSKLGKPCYVFSCYYDAHFEKYTENISSISPAGSRD